MPDVLTSAQNDIVTAPIQGSIFLQGPSGCGKTTAAVRRMAFLLQNGVPAEQILILSPQRSLAAPYSDFLHQPEFPSGGLASVVTLGGLAQRAIQLFWPVFAQQAGFTQPESPPIFLTLETAQYFMAQVVHPLMAEGYFEQLSIDRNRLLSQIVDNLNKAAVVGFPHTDLATRLKHAWIGQPSQLVLYDQVQECANRFRQYCLENNLLDFSLQFEMFANQLWPSEPVQDYLRRQYRHLIYDNLEEDVPVAHDILREWLPNFDSALLVYDTNGGNRVFLGADPDYAATLQDSCVQTVTWEDSFITGEPLRGFQSALKDSLARQLEAAPTEEAAGSFTFSSLRFFTEMVDQVCEEITRLVATEGVPPEEIVVLTPFLSDALRHALANRLGQSDIAARSIRPSRSLHDEPAARCLITLAYLAHPQWDVLPTRAEFRAMLLQVLAGMDLVRAELASGILYRHRSLQDPLGNFDQVIPDIQERITFSLGERYSRLRVWLLAYRAGQPAELDVFLSRLFGEVLSQPGFGFHENFDAAGVTARLIESIQKFRRVTEATLQASAVDTGEEYLRMVRQGVIASQYLQTYQSESGAVLIAPAYTFLMANHPVDYQFWLDIGSLGWWERLYQPLTHPYILSRHWTAEKIWTDANEYEANQETLSRLTNGLLSRCREHLYLYSTRINERGAEERGPLLQAMNTLLHHLFVAYGERHV